MFGNSFFSSAKNYCSLSPNGSIKTAPNCSFSLVLYSFWKYINLSLMHCTMCSIGRWNWFATILIAKIAWFKLPMGTSNSKMNWCEDFILFFFSKQFLGRRNTSYYTFRETHTNDVNIDGGKLIWAASLYTVPKNTHIYVGIGDFTTASDQSKTWYSQCIRTNTHTHMHIRTLSHQHSYW